MKVSKFFIISVLTLALVFTNFAPVANFTSTAEAASISITKSKLTLEVGKSETLVIKGTAKKATWKSSNKKVATVSSGGKVTAKSVGIAKITATINKKDYSCQITVKGSIDYYLKNAPYDAKSVTISTLSTIVPKEWFYQALEDLDDDNSVKDYTISIAPTEEQTSSITISIKKTNEKAADYEQLKSDLGQYLNADAIQQMMQSAYGKTAKVSDYAVSDFTTDLGTAYRVAYVLTINKVSTPYVSYTLSIDNYMIDVTVSDNEGINLDQVAQYFLKSIVVK